MNYFNEETAELDGETLWRNMFPINKLKVFKNEPIARKINVPKIKYTYQANNLKRNDIEIEVLA